MAQGVRMDGTVKARALCGSLAGMVERFCARRVIRSMPTVAGKEPIVGFSPQPTPVLAQFFEQLGAEHDIAVLAALSSLDVNHHALAVDIADLQVGYLGTPQASSVERMSRVRWKGVSAASMSRATSSWLRIVGR